MKLQILSWNVRGLNDSVRIKVVKSVIRKRGGYVVCLQETKLASTSDRLVRSLWGGRFVEWVVLDAVGSSGGILIMWDNRWVSKVDSHVERFSVSCVFSLVEDGGPFTWSSGRSPPTLSRLDRFLVFGEWEEKFSDAVQATFARPISDHVPLMLDCGGLRSRRSSFRFENMWLRDEGFLERVRSWWAGFGGIGTPSHLLAGHLRRLKGSIKIWNKEVFGNLVWRKNQVLAEIADIDRMEGQGDLADALKVRRAECKAEFAEIAIMEEISWRQKSKALWLKEGDSNTNFFHRLANAHKRGNHIGRIQVEGELLCKEEDICKGISEFYEKLFTEIVEWRPLLEGLQFASISSEECLGLEEPFSEEEVLSALKSCNRDKAPSPDGFTMRFLLECWEVVRGEVMDSFHAFHAQGSFEKSLNAIFISLIPKKGGAMDIRDFRPISLILDSVLIASEYVDSRLRSGVPGVLCKLDLEKAYDHVNWNFLLYLMERMGSKGLRQGDPLSPFLFLFVMEALSRLMSKVIELGFLRGFQVGRDAAPQLEVSHLMFADDTLVLYDANVSQLRYLRCVLIWFQVVFGLKVNVGKSVLVPAGEVPEIGFLADILGCRTGPFPIFYLRLPLGASSRCVGVWDPVVDRFEKKLAGWKKQYLSKGDSSSVAERIERLQRQFVTEVWVLEDWCLIIRLSLGNGCGDLVWRGIGFGGGSLLVVLGSLEEGGVLWRCVALEVWGFGKLFGRVGMSFPNTFVFESGMARGSAFGRMFVGHRFGMFDSGGCFKDWEIEEAICFLELLYRQRIVDGISDCWSWAATSHGCFEIRSFFRCLTDDHRAHFPWKAVWHSKAPLKVGFFAWTSVLGQIFTRDNLRRRNQVVINRCYMCLRDEESMDHLLLHCNMVRDCWNLMFGLFWDSLVYAWIR
ncbi:uncharacterized protein LOC132266370 [Cornus florida]|uniref:uncharacterized protein LOC132266370 n=1 Tax=Cornus florida TaxID=4283 RepID=UPI00289F509D|nr:uncharacterized protein LOC132266370 [Cornus florida]